jgi:hypothetical protein
MATSFTSFSSTIDSNNFRNLKNTAPLDSNLVFRKSWTPDSLTLPSPSRHQPDFDPPSIPRSMLLPSFWQTARLHRVKRCQKAFEIRTLQPLQHSVFRTE